MIEIYEHEHTSYTQDS